MFKWFSSNDDAQNRVLKDLQTMNTEQKESNQRIVDTLRELNEKLIAIIKKLGIEVNSNQPNSNGVVSNLSHKTVGEPADASGIIPVPSGIDSSARAKLTTDLHKLCDLVNKELKRGSLSNPVTISNGVSLISISHSLQEYRKTEQQINDNFAFIKSYMRANIDKCTAIMSSTKTPGNFDILLVCAGVYIRINSSFKGNPQDVDFCIELSQIQ